MPGYIHPVDIYNGETFSRVRSGAGLGWWIYHREVMWLEPDVVAEITYAEIVQGRLRAPVFRGLRSQTAPTTPPLGLLAKAWPAPKSSYARDVERENVARHTSASIFVRWSR